MKINIKIKSQIIPKQIKKYLSHSEMQLTKNMLSLKRLEEAATASS